MTSPQVQAVSGKLLQKTQFKVTRDGSTVFFHVVNRADSVKIPLTWQQAAKLGQGLRVHGRRHTKRGGLVYVSIKGTRIEMEPDVALWASPILAAEAREARRATGAGATIIATGVLSDAEANYKHGV